MLWHALYRFGVIGTILAAASIAAAQSSPSPIEQEVMANLRALPIGAHALADLDLPKAYLERVADRIIRSSYEERFRIVVPDSAGPYVPATPPGRAGGRTSLPVMTRRVVSGGAVVVVLIALAARRRRQGKP